MRHLFLLLMPVLLWADLEAIRSQPTYQRRFGMALDHAVKSFGSARAAFDSGDLRSMEARLTEVGDSLEVAAESLRTSGKQPSSNTKYLKRAELRTRELLRRLETLIGDLSADERAHAEALQDKLQRLHNEFLTGVMSRKK